MAAGELGRLLAALAPGRVMWIEVRGRSMWPLLWPGDALKVRRCTEAELRVGDVAVLLREDGTLVSHMVRACAPLETVSFVGRRDTGLVPLGVATAFRRGDRVLPLAPGVTRLAQAAFATAVRSPLRTLWERAAAFVAAPSTAAVRRAMLGDVTLAPLSPMDLHEVALALSRWESPGADELERLLSEGRGVAARGRRGHMRGLFFVHRGAMQRGHLARRYQGRGLEQQMVDALMDADVERAELEGDFLAAFSRSRSSRRGG